MKAIFFILFFFSVSELAYSQIAFTKAEATEFVNEFKKTKFITKIDLDNDEVQVRGSSWAITSLDNKRMFIKLMASYQAHKESTENMLSIDIVDDTTGKKLGYYSILWGAKIVSE